MLMGLLSLTELYGCLSIALALISCARQISNNPLTLVSTNSFAQMGRLELLSIRHGDAGLRLASQAFAGLPPAATM